MSMMFRALSIICNLEKFHDHILVGAGGHLRDIERLKGSTASQKTYLETVSNWEERVSMKKKSIVRSIHSTIMYATGGLYVSGLVVKPKQKKTNCMVIAHVLCIPTRAELGFGRMK